MVLRADGSVEELGAPGTLLGLVERPADRRTAAATLRPGDTLVLYTDGLTEAGAPAELWSTEDLARVLRGAAGGPRRRRWSTTLVAEALGGLAAQPRDDIAVVALRAQRADQPA